MKSHRRRTVTAPEYLRPALGAMLHSLREGRLDVGLATAPDPRHSGHRIRVVNGQNPEWYQELCSQYTVHRRNTRKRLGKKHHDTRIRRKRIIQALTTLHAGRGARSWYADDLLRAAEDLWEEWEEEAEDVPAFESPAPPVPFEADDF